MSSLLRSERYSLEEYFALERASERRFEYRDGEIVCMSGGSIEHAAIASNLVEVLSPASADYDRGTKFQEYKSIPTLTDYLLVAQDRPHIVRRTRQDPNTWHETAFDALEATIRLNSIGVPLDNMREVYEGLPFE